MKRFFMAQKGFRLGCHRVQKENDNMMKRSKEGVWGEGRESRTGEGGEGDKDEVFWKEGVLGLE